MNLPSRQTVIQIDAAYSPYVVLVTLTVFEIFRCLEGE